MLYVWYYLLYYYCLYFEIYDVIKENNIYLVDLFWKVVLGIGESCWIYGVFLVYRDEVEGFKLCF